MASLQQISDGSLDDVEFPNFSHPVEPDEDDNDHFELPAHFLETSLAVGKNMRDLFPVTLLNIFC